MKLVERLYQEAYESKQLWIHLLCTEIEKKADEANTGYWAKGELVRIALIECIKRLEVIGSGEDA